MSPPFKIGTGSMFAAASFVAINATQAKNEFTFRKLYNSFNNSEPIERGEKAP